MTISKSKLTNESSFLNSFSWFNHVWKYVAKILLLFLPLNLSLKGKKNFAMPTLPPKRDNPRKNSDAQNSDIRFSTLPPLPGNEWWVDNIQIGAKQTAL